MSKTHGSKTSTKAGRTSQKWCTCGFKRHGKNHEEGEHHKKGSK